MLPNKPRGVRRVNDRRVLNGIFWVLRSGAPWRDLPTAFGPYTTCYNRFVRWRRSGVWGRIIEALAAAHDAAVQMIDTIVRVHQHGACITRNQRQSMGRSRGGLTSKIHAVVDGNGLPIRLALSPGEAHDVRLAGKLLSRLLGRHGIGRRFRRGHGARARQRQRFGALLRSDRQREDRSRRNTEPAQQSTPLIALPHHRTSLTTATTAAQHRSRSHCVDCSRSRHDARNRRVNAP
ncbi:MULTISPECIES: IS5 family transposase [unclassified Bradyrhizobium]